MYGTLEDIKESLSELNKSIKALIESTNDNNTTMKKFNKWLIGLTLILVALGIIGALQYLPKLKDLLQNLIT